MIPLSKSLTLLFFLLVSIDPAHAHELFTSYTSIEIRDDRLFCVFTLNQTDLSMIFDLDEDGNGEVSRDELHLNLDEMYDYVEENFRVIIGGEILEMDRQGASVTEDNLGNMSAKFDFVKKLSFQPWKLTLGLSFFQDFGPRHKNLAKVLYGSELQQTIFTVGDPEQSFSFEGQDVQLTRQIRQFVWLGMEHILIGYDHILFLLGLIIIGGSFRNLIKIVTSFTIAHSITLILAALQVVSIPGRLVESVIALSIVYIAVENFLVKNTDDRWLITFIFGLMHGFGFASVLAGLGLPTKGLIASLLSFNIGVEIGQLAIVAVIFPVVLLLYKSRWRKQFVYGLSSLILVFGLVWFIERAFAVDFPVV